MVQKRHLAEEEYDVSPKHLKLEHSCDLVPSLQFTKEDSSFQSDKDEGCFFKPIIGVDYEFVSGKFSDVPVYTTKDNAYTLPGRLSTSSWASSTTTEEDVNSEARLDHSPLRPRTLIHPDDAYSYLLKSSPLKQVPIGPEHQAEIPEWHGRDEHVDNSEDEIKLMGSCVVLMPEDHNTDDYETIADCYCRNPRSVGCVRQHIKEARETLKGMIGNERFTELGFDNMGEVVAEKWSEEDEQLFHEVVYSNPVSLGKNFWSNLAEVFPTRSNKEIVSYYFNVFMLRKRAEQNRCDPANADSDDDEWQGSDKSDEKDEYDSDCFESPVKDLGISSESDFQKDSCTSSKSWGNHEFIFEPSDSKVWDIGYFSCPEPKNDFLSTGSMIEEVFGVESWDFQVADDDDDKSSI